jgi:hypothetical protein
MSADTPIVLITPDAKAALETEVERTGVSTDLVGGLLFGYPLDAHRRLVVDSVRPRPEVGFGRKGFSIDQSRTSQRLAEIRQLAPKADYCGVWYLHRTPEPELTDDEWVQAQSVLEDPDFRLQDLVCLVICFYFGELTLHAMSFNRYQSARGQLPEPTELQVLTDSDARAEAAPATRPSPTEWFKSPEVAERLGQERKQLAQAYHVEPTVAPDGQVIFCLRPKSEWGKLTFYLACGPGFPAEAPAAFLVAGGKQYPLVSTVLGDWTAGQQLVNVADDLIKWLSWSLEQYVTTAEEALNQGDHQEAADLLTAVLSIDPRTPRAARLLARAQARLSN